MQISSSIQHEPIQYSFSDQKKFRQKIMYNLYGKLLVQSKSEDFGLEFCLSMGVHSVLVLQGPVSTCAKPVE